MFGLIPSRIGNMSTFGRGYATPFTDDFFRAFFGDEKNPGTFRVDIADRGDHYLMEAELPGIARDDLRIDIDENRLTISAEINQVKQGNENSYVCRERRYGAMSRSFNIEGIREGDITAQYADGVLRLTLPKEQEKPVSSARRVEIQ